MFAECSGGLSQHIIFKWALMVSEGDSYIHKVGLSHYRPVCDKGEQKMLQILLQRRPGPGISVRCVLDPLNSGSNVYVSSDSTNPKSPLGTQGTSSLKAENLLADQSI